MLGYGDCTNHAGLLLAIHTVSLTYLRHVVPYYTYFTVQSVRVPPPS